MSCNQGRDKWILKKVYLFEELGGIYNVFGMDILVDSVIQHSLLWIIE